MDVLHAAVASLKGFTLNAVKPASSRTKALLLKDRENALDQDGSGQSTHERDVAAYEEMTRLCEFTHLVTEADARTMKVLFALARGQWIVRPSWVLESVEKGHWVDELDHEVSVFPGARKAREARENRWELTLDISLSSQLAAKSSAKLFSGLVFFVLDVGTKQGQVKKKNIK